MTGIRNTSLALILVSLMLIASAGCSALSAPDPAATLVANRAALDMEATSIAQAAQAQATEIRATVSAAETSVVLGEQVNSQLLLTMRAVFPPTAQIIQNEGAATPGQVASPAPPGMMGLPTTPGAPITPELNRNATGSTLFTEVGTALVVRDDDGCAAGLVSAFAGDVQRIYVTTRALNITGGMIMRVQWNFEGELSFEESFTVAENDDDFCLWFYIEPTNATFGAGNWTVQMFADERPVSDPISFTVGV